MSEYDKGLDALWQGYYAEPISPNELLEFIKSRTINASHLKSGTIDTRLIKVLAEYTTGASLTIDSTGLVANDGTKDTFKIGTDGSATFSGDIDTDADVNVGNNINIGEDDLFHPSKSIYFSGGANITNPQDSNDIHFSANVFLFDDGDIFIGTDTIPPFNMYVYHETTFYDDVRFEKDIIQPTWTAPTLTNSWVNYGAPYENVKYRRNRMGQVEIKGTVKSGTMSSPIFTLPTGYRPLGEKLYVTASFGTTATVHIDTNGGVLATSGDNQLINLDIIMAI